MFSYRHAFHAGNFADVHKHLSQLLLLQHLQQKPKPITYIDTHAGGGCYDLSAEQAVKTGEAEQGIKQLGQSQQPLLQLYQQLLAPFLAEGQYPGSPLLAKQMQRPGDKLHLVEWHNNEIQVLRQHLGKQRNIAIHHSDGFAALKALLPPKPARGLVLIDPPYERSEEYQQVVDALALALKRWPQGVFAVWYPLLTNKKALAGQMLEQIQALAPPNMLSCELRVREAKPDSGMVGSGICVLNMPWQADKSLAQVMPELVQQLGQDAQASSELRWWIEPS